VNKAKAIAQLYAELPAIECKGKCSDSCGPIEMTKTEGKTLKKRLGHRVAVCGDDLKCPMLTPAGWCSVYSDRPAICRLWGIADPMICPHGCVPEGGHWSRAKGFAWLQAIYTVDGDGDMERAFAEQVDTRPAWFKSAQRAAMVSHFSNGGSLGDWLDAHKPT
jgi:hypothetical protein